jgi:ABC-type antimicrobial peptide transport system permease subunit
MKAVGGGEHEIRRIFFFEAGIIGFIGAVFGLLTGWGVTKIANFIINMQLKLARESPVDMFYFPLWLILGATAFSILISIISGMYPAIRASRIDPVKALRHD